MNIMDEKTKIEKDKTRVRNYFKRNIDKANVLTYLDLKNYVKKYKLTVSNRFIKNLKKDVLPSALYSQFEPIDDFETINVPRLGYLSMDFAFYKKEWAGYNRGFIGFLMIVSVSPGKRWAIPMKNRKTSSFEKALEEVCMGNIFPSITEILSDRETTIYSTNFQKKMKKLYDIEFGFLERYSKAFNAENAIRHTKNDLSIALISNGGKNWVDLLPEVIYNHNRQVIPGTSYSPLTIDKTNFNDYLSECNNVEDASMTFNTNSEDSRAFANKQWLRKIFEFKVGDRVLATKYALEGRKAFQKSSVEGTFSRTPYFIKRAKLNNSKDDVLVQGKTIQYLMLNISL